MKVSSVTRRPPLQKRTDSVVPAMIRTNGARLDLSSHRQAPRLSSKGALKSSGPMRTVQLRQRLNRGSKSSRRQNGVVQVRLPINLVAIQDRNCMEELHE